MTLAGVRHHAYLAAFLVLAVVLAFVASLPASAMTLRLPQIHRAAGDNIEVAIEVAEAEKVGALQFEVLYDASVLTAVSARAGALASDALVEFKADQPGRLFIALVTTNSINGYGIVAKASFKVIGTPGKVTALDFAAAQAWEGITHREVLLNSVSGQLTVTEPRLLWLWILMGIAILLVLLYMIPRARAETLET